MTTYLVTVKHNSQLHLNIELVPYENDFKQFYRVLDIDTFDIVRSNVYTPYISTDKGLLLYVDDNGLLKDSYPTFPTFQQLPNGSLGECVGMIVGNVAFAHENEFNPSETRGLEYLEAVSLADQISHWFSFHTKFIVDNVITDNNYTPFS